MTNTTPEPFRVTGRTKRQLSPLKMAFWPNVGASSHAQCWLWKPAMHAGTYGIFAWQGERIQAHRLSLALKLGHDIPDDAFVCHTCDHPRCVNPGHLYIGDNSTNQRDRWEVGRKTAIKIKVTVKAETADGKTIERSGDAISRTDRERVIQRLTERLIKAGAVKRFRVKAVRRKPVRRACNTYS